MIEFKAECGHTVRARDEDASGVVRCSYCGRNAAVPDNVESGLDHLFREIEETGETDRTYKRPRRRRRKKPRVPKGDGGAFDPFSIVLKLCYVAVLVIIVYVVAQKAIMPLFRGEKPADLFAKKDGADRPREDGRHLRDHGRKAGLLSKRVTGLYVSSVPTGASVFVLEASRAPSAGRIAGLQGVREFRTDTSCSRLADGEYVVEVTLPCHDRNLSRYRGYWSFRRSIEHADDAERRRVLSEYFIPDDAVDVFVHETEDKMYLVRQYRVELQRDGARGVQALFLPRIPSDDGKRFAIEPLVTECIPEGKRYAFDEELVNNELTYYGVLSTDRPFVVEALRRVGAISYITSDGRTRLFRIGVADGEFARKVIREPTT